MDLIKRDIDESILVSCLQTKKIKIEEALKKLENKSKHKQNIGVKFLEKFNDMFPKSITFEIIDGVRHLSPYWSIFGSYTKKRWVGREISEVFSTEFLSHNKYYPKSAIRMGRLFINGKQMTNPHYQFRSSDHVLHLGHRHEHPILAKPEITVLEDNENWFVINKPASIPVHACGQYRIHSVIGLLRTMYNITGLKVCHRLDRTTSGVLVFGKNNESTKIFKEMLDQKEIYKEYICKVDGIFPENDIICDAKIGILSVTMGIQCVRDDGKEAFSKFSRISVNETEKTSLVLCRIETGRTHQIRVHLQYLGYPIVDDIFYNDYVWGPEKGKFANFGKTLNELKNDVQARHQSSIWIEDSDPEYEDRLISIANNNLQLPDFLDMKNLDLDSLPKYDSICLGCNVTKRMPLQKHFRLMLHCLRYKSQNWSFEAPLPDWAELRVEEKKKINISLNNVSSTESVAN